jgi:hypothetical protein
VPNVAALPGDTAREALGLLGGNPAGGGRAQALRALRDLFAGHGFVRGLLDHAPPGARAAFVRLAQDGPTPVEDLLGRGWWGRGTLPPPLDWLQRRGLVVAGQDGLVYAVDEAREGFLRLTLDLTTPPEPADDPLRVEAVESVVIAPSRAELDRAVAVTGAALRGVAPTVAVSTKSARVVSAALRSAGLRLDDDAVVAVDAGVPALPGTVEEAVGPRAVRTLLQRGVAEQRQVWLRYFASSRGGATTERVVDPWAFGDDLLRGYCHLRAGERTFAVDRIGHARLLPSAVDHPPPG